MLKSQSLGPVYVTLFGNSVIADIIDLRWGGPSSNDWCPYEKRRSDIDTHTGTWPCGDEGRDWRWMLPRDKEHQGRSATTRSQREQILRVPEKEPMLLHLDFRFLTSRTLQEYISVVLNHLVCGTLLQSPRKLGLIPKTVWSQSVPPGKGAGRKEIRHLPQRNWVSLKETPLKWDL